MARCIYSVARKQEHLVPECRCRSNVEWWHVNQRVDCFRFASCELDGTIVFRVACLVLCVILKYSEIVTYYCDILHDFNILRSFSIAALRMNEFGINRQTETVSCMQGLSLTNYKYYLSIQSCQHRQNILSSS